LVIFIGHKFHKKRYFPFFGAHQKRFPNSINHITSHSITTKFRMRLVQPSTRTPILDLKPDQNYKKVTIYPMNKYLYLQEDVSYSLSCQLQLFEHTPNPPLLSTTNPPIHPPLNKCLYDSNIHLINNPKPSYFTDHQPQT